jgi:ATP-dependent DNA helicase RecQ
MEDAHEALAAHFGYGDFRPGQQTVIEALLAGHDVMAVMPTGAGKSICYQIPAVLLDGLTIVVSPLISLMADQVRGLKEAGIRGSFYNSTLKPHVRPEVLRRARLGWYDLMYVAPERLADPEFRGFAAAAHVRLVAVDEAHCVSQWGNDFRPAYRGIADFVTSLPTRPPVAALTATATRQVQDDVRSLLALQDPTVVVSGFDRPNLSLYSFELAPKGRERWTCDYVRAHPHESGIVYALTRKKVEQVCEQLRACGVSAAAYHAGMTDVQRTQAQEAFIRDDVQVLVATNAFGMGIDKSNVRYVINCGMPQTLEEYYQEAGRAGRDGEPAACFLLWSRGDIRTCHFFIDNTEYASDVTPAEQSFLREHRRRLLSEMIGYAMSTTCLRQRILRYFGQRNGVAREGCGTCSVCRGTRPRDRRGGTAFEDNDLEAQGGPPVRGDKPSRRGLPATPLGSAHEADDAGRDDEELFQRLRALRKRLADERQVPPYVVFSDKTLRGMVRRRPTTEEELLEVSGVGAVKLERYGAAFLDELRL